MSSGTAVRLPERALLLTRLPSRHKPSGRTGYIEGL